MTFSPRSPCVSRMSGACSPDQSVLWQRRRSRCRRGGAGVMAVTRGSVQGSVAAAGVGASVTSCCSSRCLGGGASELTPLHSRLDIRRPLTQRPPSVRWAQGCVGRRVGAVSCGFLQKLTTTYLFTIGAFCDFRVFSYRCHPLGQ